MAQISVNLVDKNEIIGVSVTFFLSMGVYKLGITIS